MSDICTCANCGKQAPVAVCDRLNRLYCSLQCCQQKEDAMREANEQADAERRACEEEDPGAPGE